MANFLKHQPCPKCGSKDNLGVYDDGGWFCFGCGFTKRADIGVVLRNVHVDSGVREKEHKRLPDDVSRVIGDSGVSWLGKYGIDVEVALKNNILWSDRRQQLIFTFPETELWQARNFGEFGKKVKYITSGNHDDVLPIYNEVDSDTCVVVEDCVSAIRIAMARGLEGSGWHAMPLLGSHLPTKKLNRLRRLYSKMVVWLDHDKGKEAQAIARRGSLVGLSSRVIHTELDPKEFSAEGLTTLLEDGTIFL